MQSVHLNDFFFDGISDIDTPLNPSQSDQPLRFKWILCTLIILVDILVPPCLERFYCIVQRFWVHIDFV